MNSSPALLSPLRGLGEGWDAPKTRGSRPGLFHVAPPGLSGSGAWFKPRMDKPRMEMPLELALPPLPGVRVCGRERGRG